MAPPITPGENNFLTFAEHGSRPEMVMLDEMYKDNPRRKTGFAGGEPADNSLMNTVLRNLTLSMKGLADVIAENGVDVPQDITAEVVKTGLTKTISNMINEIVVDAVTPTLTAMQKQIDDYAGAYHGVPVGGILPISCSEAELEAFLDKYPHYAVCNGQNGTVNLQDRFIICASPNTKVNAVGGNNSFSGLEIMDHVLTEEQMPVHKHEVPGSNDTFDVTKWPFGAPIGSQMYMGFEVGKVGFRSNSSPKGKSKGHSHKLKDKTGDNKGMLPPYYALIFVQKIRPY